MKMFYAVATGTLVMVGAVNAEDAAKPGMLGWSGKIEGGYNAASGNSDNSNMKLDAEAKREWSEWALKGHAKARFAESNDERSEENYNFGVQGDRKLSDIDYLFAAAEYTVDNFSGYDYQATQTVGYGRTLLQTDKQTLKGQMGLGLRESKTETGETNVDPVLKPELDYALKLNDNVTFTQKGEATMGTEFTVLETETGLKSNLTDNLYLKASYTIRHTTDVPVNRKKTDTFTGISVGYSF